MYNTTDIIDNINTQYTVRKNNLGKLVLVFLTTTTFGTAGAVFAFSEFDDDIKPLG